MASRTLRAILLGDNQSLVKSFNDSALVSEDATGKIEKNTSRLGGLFTNLGNTASNLGIPFAGALTSVGSKFDETEGKGRSAFQRLSSFGGTALLGLAAGTVAVGSEALKMADAYDTAAASMDTAIKNNGGNLRSLKPQIDASFASMAKLGFNSTDTATALTTLTTATGSPKKAIADLGLAADLARMKHISLAEASGILAKTFAGSTRALTSLGLNLDIGSAKLSSMHTASQALATAQLHLEQTQQKIADGSLKGVAAQQALATAQNSVSVASDHLRRDQQASGDILAELKKKTEGAAVAYGKTLPGEMQTARAEVHNLGTQFGEFLTPKIQMAISTVSKSIGWLEKHKDVAKVLAGVIGGVLAIAVAAFAVNMTVKFVGSISKAVGAVGKLGSKLLDTIPNFAASSEAASAAAAAQTEAGDAIQLSFGEVEAAEAEFAASSEATGAASSMAFGPIGIAIMAIVAIGLLLVTHWKQVESVAKTVWHKVQRVFDDFWGFVKKWGPLVLEVVLAPFTLGMSLILPQVIKHWHTIESFFTSIPGRILHALGDVAQMLVDAGEKILEGLLHGMEKGIGKIGSIMKSIGKSILHGITSFFGIFSPSRVMADVGGNLMDGLAKGISDRSDKAHSAMQSAVKRVSQATATSPNSASSGSSATSSNLADQRAQALLVVSVKDTAVSLSLLRQTVSEMAAATKQFTAEEQKATQALKQEINVHVQTNANPSEIASEVGWAMRI